MANNGKCCKKLLPSFLLRTKSLKTRLLEDEHQQEMTNYHSKMKPIRPLDATVTLGGFTKDKSKKVMCLIISCYPQEKPNKL